MGGRDIKGKNLGFSRDPPKKVDEKGGFIQNAREFSVNSSCLPRFLFIFMYIYIYIFMCCIYVYV